MILSRGRNGLGRWRVGAVAVAFVAVTASASGAPPTTDALREKYPEYAAALSALGEEQMATAIASLSKLAKAGDPHLVADASFYLGRALFIEQRCEEALPLFTRLSGEQAANSTYAAESLYMQGACEARLLKRKEAIATWEKFLKNHPDAPERMRVDAESQLANLKQIGDGSIGDIQHRMDYAGRRLSLADPGRDTRDRQEEIVAMLTKLIREEEEDQNQNEQQQEQNQDQQEQEGQGQPGSKPGQKGSGGKPGSGPGGKTPGGNRQASGDDVSGRAHQATDRGQFGEIRDRERMERIFSAMKSRYPAQYRKLVEQYSKSLQEDRE